jgi:hypothetical protein
MRHWWNDIDRGKWKYWETNLSHKDFPEMKAVFRRSEISY